MHSISKNLFSPLSRFGLHLARARIEPARHSPAMPVLWEFWHFHWKKWCLFDEAWAAAVETTFSDQKLSVESVEWPEEAEFVKWKVHFDSRFAICTTRSGPQEETMHRQHRLVYGEGQSRWRINCDRPVRRRITKDPWCQ